MKKDNLFYFVVFVLLALLIWQWVAKSGLENRIGGLNKQITELQKDHDDLLLLSGLGQLRSTHIHADIKVYINGKSIDFSQPKYQLAARFIHFEEGIGDVVHVHATGHTMGHLFKSLELDFDNNCIVAGNNDYCNEGNRKLRFYVNGNPNSEYDNYEIKDLDRILVSYGTESEIEIQRQLDSITNLAPRLSGKE